MADSFLPRWSLRTEGAIMPDERLPTGQMVRPRYDYVVENDTLTLTAQEASKQTFQFQRQVE